MQADLCHSLRMEKSKLMKITIANSRSRDRTCPIGSLKGNQNGHVQEFQWVRERETKSIYRNARKTPSRESKLLTNLNIGVVMQSVTFRVFSLEYFFLCFVRLSVFHFAPRRFFSFSRLLPPSASTDVAGAQVKRPRFDFFRRSEISNVTGFTHVVLLWL